MRNYWQILLLPSVVVLAVLFCRGNAEAAFRSSLAISRDVVYTDTTTTLHATIAIDSQPALQKVSLVRVRVSDLAELAELVVFFDDGDTAVHLDDIPHDDNYANNVAITPVDTAPYLVRAKAEYTTGAFEYSETFVIIVATRITDLAIADMAIFGQDFLNQFALGQANALTWLLLQNEVETAGIAPSDSGIWWVDNNRYLHGYHPVNTGQRTGGNLPLRSPPAPEATAGSSRLQTLNYRPAGNFSGVGNRALAPPRRAPDAAFDYVGNQKVIYLGPYRGVPGAIPPNFGFTDDYYAALQRFKDVTDYIVTEYFNADVTVDHFKNLDDYGIIIIASHGDNWYLGLWSWWENKWGNPAFPVEFQLDAGSWGDDASQCVVYTGVQLTPANKAQYQDDLETHRLALDPSNELIITPDFIRHYNTNMPHSLVYIATCRSAYNTSLAEAFIARGAKSFFGYSDYVISEYAQNCDNRVAERMITNDATSGEAHAAAISAYGADDGGADPAEFVLIGSNNLKLNHSDIINGSFAEGHFNGWNTSGDARILTCLGTLSPADGEYMGVISTGLGSVLESTSEITQIFTIPQGTSGIEFSYDFISEEPMEFVGMAFDDKMEIKLRDGNGADLPGYLVSETVNGSTWFPLDGVDFSGGDATVFHTKWKDVAWDVSALTANGPVKVTFSAKAWDRGDGIYDSALLLDYIRLIIPNTDPARPAANLQNVIIYPNPYVPEDGDPGNGIPYGGPGDGSGIYMINLVPGTRINIYDVRGREVEGMIVPAGTGMVQWDVRTKDGDEVASGLYVAVFMNGGERVARKFMVVR